MVKRVVNMIKLTTADTFTLLNALSGFLGITYVLDGKYHLAALFIFSSVIFDGLDGLSYRRFGSTHKAGDKLDSLADSISFVIFPAIFLYSMYYDPSRGAAFEDLKNAATVIAVFAILSSGIYHLGVFVAHGPDKFFLGQPTPLAAIIIVESIFLLPQPFVEVLAILLSISMAIPITIPKVNRRDSIIAFFILLFSASYFILCLLGTDIPPILWTAFIITSAYAIFISIAPHFKN